ncbi:MAG: hypothetical protein ACI94Y_003066 [Maribacter sp.]|jgi:hypothetical protein
MSFIFYTFCFGQDSNLYPIKKGGKWGVINQQGKIIIQPTYDAISNFKHYGYAVIQKEGNSGLIDSRGAFVFPAKYKDLRVISKHLFGIKSEGTWNVIDKQGNILIRDYDSASPLDDKHILYWQKELCGLVDLNGKIIIPANYQSIKWDKDKTLFIVKKNKKIGLYTTKGEVIREPVFREIQIINTGLILTKRRYKWGAIDGDGQELLADLFSHFKISSYNFLLIYKQERCYLYSIDERSMIGNEFFNNYIPLNKNWIVFQKFKTMGLMDSTGRIVAPALFQEIRPFGDNNFRIKTNGKWGIINNENENISPPIYDYISPLNNYISIVKKDEKFGILHENGKLIINTVYNKIDIKDGQIKAYQGEKLSIFIITEEGLKQGDEFKQYASISIKKRESKKEENRKKENHQISNYEWFYAPEEKKWGLRNIQDGSTRLSPQYDFIDIKMTHHFTVAGTRKAMTQQFGDFPVRFNFHFKLIDNKTGVIVSKHLFREIRFSDFDQGPTARAILDNGRHALIDKKGQIVCMGYAYIGEFNEGLAPMVMQGTLSAAKNKNDFIICPMKEYLIGSYGSYILGDFGNMPQFIPNLSCKDCSWGYIDTLGRMKVPPDYQAATPFINNIGIVKKAGKWGLVNRMAEEILPCQYSKITYFDDASPILHIESKCKKYGLVDSLGTTVSESKFDNIREECGGLMAFRKNKKWGYILSNGHAAINEQYVKANDFKENKAAVFDGFKWGFINKRGELIIDFQYSRAGNFNSGLAWAKTTKGFGYINEKNEFVIPPQFRKAYDFEGGVARVKEKGKIRLINMRGVFISSYQFDDLSSFDKYNLAVARGNFKNSIYYFLVNKKGEKVGNQTFRRIYPFREGMAAVKKKGKYGFINAQGQLIVPATFDKVSQFSEGFAWVKINGNCGYINKMGKFVVQPEFSKCKDFEDGRAIVYVNARKGGLVDKGGDYVLEPKLNRLLAFTEGKGLVKDNEKFYFVRESGEIYEGYYDTAKTFENGTAFIEIDGYWGIINKKGATIITPKYDSIERMNNNINKVKVSKLHGIIRPNGSFLLYPTYEYLNYMGNGIIRIEQGGKIGYMDLEGKWIWKLEG